jgi:pyruvate/2-oxoglutarate dehydrogenase complex dihydrolipoamide acyltransferase (E2) component
MNPSLPHRTLLAGTVPARLQAITSIVYFRRMSEVLLPKWGVSMREATVTRWHRSPGDAISVGDPLADLETDKVEMTLESPHSGTLVAILVPVDGSAPVGAPLAIIE